MPQRRPDSVVIVAVSLYPQHMLFTCMHSTSALVVSLKLTQPLQEPRAPVISRSTHTSGLASASTLAPPAASRAASASTGRDCGADCSATASAPSYDSLHGHVLCTHEKV